MENGKQTQSMADSGNRENASSRSAKDTTAWSEDAQNPMNDMGGYADCCGASEADEACPYRRPTEAEVAKFSRKQEARA